MKEVGNPRILYIYWVLWFLSMFLLLISHFKDMPHLIRVVHLIQIVRNLVPLFNFENRVIIDDLAELVRFGTTQSISLNVMLILMCLTEKYYVHLPLSIGFQSFLGFALVALFYQKSGTEKHLGYVMNNKKYIVFKLAFSQFVI